MHQTQIITTLIICAICLIGGTFVLFSNSHRRINRLVFYLTVATALSLPAQGVFEYIDPSHVLFWARYDTSTTIILDALTLLVASNFPRRLFSRKVEATFLIVSVALAAISFSPFMIATAFSDGNIVKVTTGMLMPPFYAVDAAYTLMIVPALIFQYRRGRKLDKLRIKYLMLGIGIIAFMISILGLWLPVFFHVNGATDYVPFVILLGIGFILYDVVAFRLLSIRFVVARSVAYTLLLVCIAGGYYFFAFWVGQHIFGATKLSQSDQIYQVVIAFMLAFLFQPVRSFFEKLTDRIFYKEHYNTQKVVNGFSRILVSERDIEPLLQRSLAILCSQLHISSGQVIAYDKGRVFALQSYKTAELAAETAIAEFRKFKENIVISEYLSDDDARRVLMDQMHIPAVIKLVSQNEEIGTLLLGDKLSSDIYSAQDIGTLEIISQELAVAVQNARAYRELQEAQAKLQKTDELKSEFIALGSHSLRTPVTTIRMVAEMMGSAKTLQEATGYVGMLSNVSNELANFVEELLIISTIEAGGEYSSFEVRTAEEIVQPIIAPVQAAAKTKGLAFTATFQSKDMRIRANPAHLRIVIRSLLDNAIKFTASGQVGVTVSKEDNQCVIRVTDTGVGISDEELKNLFTKFHRGTDYQRYDYAGAGVGLYLARLIVGEHGGNITVKSQLHQGTTVTIRLPLTDQEHFE
ncbi:MAG TPA: ATP-binding protein [Patescibacteria group bacterium]|nr:ATP-binding protein [Patescibacteria group bacterium]